MAPLVSLTQIKAASGNNNPDAPSPEDAKLTLAVNAASDLIRSFTGLRFEATTSVASERRFEYDGSGYLDIDEASSITSVTMTGGYSGSLTNSLTIDEWSAYPLNMPVKLWLRLSEFAYGGISPEMGFTYNLDTLYYKYPLKPNIVAVTAVWGWPTIPFDVQQAAIWTALSISESPKPYQQESIANYSRTRGSEGQHEAIPERAQAALQPYLLLNV